MNPVEAACSVKRIPYALAFAFAFAWILDVSLLVPDSVATALQFTAYPHLAFTTGAFVVVVALGEQAESLFSVPARFAACSFACFLCVMLAGIADFMSISLPVPFLLVFTGAVSLYQAIAIVACLKRFAQLPLVDCMLTLAVWQLFVALLRAWTVWMPSWVVTAAAPVALLVCLLGASGKESNPVQDAAVESEAEREDAQWFPIRLLIINAIVIFTIQTLQCVADGPVANISYIGSLIGICVVGVAFIAKKRFVRVQNLYRASLVGLELAIIVFAVNTAWAQWVSSILLDAAYATFAIFFITTLCNACQRNNQKSVRILAAAYLFEQVAALVGNTVGASMGEDTRVLLLTLLAGLGAIAFLCLATNDDYLTAWKTTPRKSKLTDPMQYYYSLSEICSSAAMQYSLSPRESEVLLLLAQKKTATQIAEELYVSPATVKTHTHNVYKKIGVHTKQEMLDLFGV